MMIVVKWWWWKRMGLWSIYNRKVLSVCLSRKMITLPNGLKSSSLAVAVSFFKHCNNKMFSMNCTCQQKFVFELLIVSKYIFHFAKNRGKKGKSTEKVMKRYKKVQQSTDDGWLMTDDRWQMADKGRRMTNDEWWMTNDKRWMTDGGWRMTDGEWRMTDDGWRTVDDGRRMMDDGWQSRLGPIRAECRRHKARRSEHPRMCPPKL